MRLNEISEDALIEVSRAQRMAESHYGYDVWQLCQNASELHAKIQHPFVAEALRPDLSNLIRAERELKAVIRAVMAKKEDAA